MIIPAPASSTLSGTTHEERSKSMYSSTFSCGDSGCVVSQPVGGSSRDVPGVAPHDSARVRNTGGAVDPVVRGAADVQPAEDRAAAVLPAAVALRRGIHGGVEGEIERRRGRRVSRRVELNPRLRGLLIRDARVVSGLRDADVGRGNGGPENRRTERADVPEPGVERRPLGEGAPPRQRRHDLSPHDVRPHPAGADAR